MEAVAVRDMVRVVRTYRIGVTQMVEEETKELNNDDTKGRPGKTRDVYVILAQLRETDIKT